MHSAHVMLDSEGIVDCFSDLEVCKPAFVRAVDDEACRFSPFSWLLLATTWTILDAPTASSLRRPPRLPCSTMTHLSLKTTTPQQFDHYEQCDDMC